MTLVFDGRRGLVPPPGSMEYIVLAACCDRRAWTQLKRLEPGDFEWAIDQLRAMGWGFVWTNLQ